jgi:hypothetical protein
MKKLLTILILAVVSINYVHAQKLNTDTLVKYSKREEQLKVFKKIAADIHLDQAQTLKFNQISAIYSDKAISVVKNDHTGNYDKMGQLRQLLKEYSEKVKQILSPEQFTMLKSEREKYHFGKRFISLSE